MDMEGLGRGLLFLLVLVPGRRALYQSPHVEGKCFDNKTYPVKIDKHWDENLCFDNEGNKYEAGDHLLSCCGCLTLTCSVVASTSTYARWSSSWNVTVDVSCCQDCHGKVYPAGSVISKHVIKDSCATTVTNHCVFISNGKESKAVTSTNFDYGSCCVDAGGLHSVNTTIPYPATCTERLCLRPSGNLFANWVSTSFQPGCDCCLHNDKLVPDGGVVVLRDGEEATCCEGELRVPLQTKTNTDTDTDTNENDDKRDNGVDKGGEKQGLSPTTSKQATSTTIDTRTTTTTKTTTTTSTASQKNAGPGIPVDIDIFEIIPEGDPPTTVPPPTTTRTTTVPTTTTTRTTTIRTSTLQTTTIQHYEQHNNLPTSHVNCFIDPLGKGKCPENSGCFLDEAGKHGEVGNHGYCHCFLGFYYNSSTNTCDDMRGGGNCRGNNQAKFCYEDEEGWEFCPYCVVHHKDEKLSLGKYVSGEGSYHDEDPQIFAYGTSTKRSRDSCNKPRSAEAYWYCWYDVFPEPHVSLDASLIHWSEPDTCAYLLYVYTPLACCFADPTEPCQN